MENSYMYLHYDIILQNKLLFFNSKGDDNYLPFQKTNKSINK